MQATAVNSSERFADLQTDRKQSATATGSSLGSVDSSLHLLFHGVLPLGPFAGSALAQAVGVRLALLIGAIGVLLSAMWLVFSLVRRLRKLRHSPRACRAAANRGKSGDRALRLAAIVLCVIIE